MDQRVVMITPTTSAWAAIASTELAAVSNMRMVGSPRRINPAGEPMNFVA